ncbi:hypothetical protein BDR04DRAFT_1152599 [Suillus decipiens]|nr:hypothetical protein BDR04DRAFT_1152599 [Suillus decipiens]
MQAVCDLLWAKAVKMKVTLTLIASVTSSNIKSFPYQLSDGSIAVFSVEANGLLAASEGECIAVCPLCEAKVLDMHCHVGQHILHVLCNTPDIINMKEQIGVTYPCGFCGHSGQQECAITIMIPNKPCQNLPLKCTLCHPALPPEPGRSS